MTATSPRSRFRSPLPALVLALIFVLTAPVPRATAAQDAGAFIANIGTQGIQAVGAGVPSPERLARFRQLLREDFDIPGIGLFALGRYRSSATPQEQQEFLRGLQRSARRATSADRAGTVTRGEPPGKSSLQDLDGPDGIVVYPSGVGSSLFTR
jgi:hypothetical protein